MPCLSSINQCLRIRLYSAFDYIQSLQSASQIHIRRPGPPFLSARPPSAFCSFPSPPSGAHLACCPYKKWPLSCWRLAVSHHAMVLMQPCSAPAAQAQLLTSNILVQPSIALCKQSVSEEFPRAWCCTATVAELN